MKLYRGPICRGTWHPFRIKVWTVGPLKWRTRIRAVPDIIRTEGATDGAEESGRAANEMFHLRREHQSDCREPTRNTAPLVLQETPWKPFFPSKHSTFDGIRNAVPATKSARKKPRPMGFVGAIQNPSPLVKIITFDDFKGIGLGWSRIFASSKHQKAWLEIRVQHARAKRSLSKINKVLMAGRERHSFQQQKMQRYLQMVATPICNCGRWCLVAHLPCLVKTASRVGWVFITKQLRSDHRYRRNESKYLKNTTHKKHEYRERALL